MARLGKISKHYRYYKSCDRSSTNFSSKICEHVLAVAQVKGVLKKFLAWFKGRRKRATVMDMVEESGPKTAGKKPVQRQNDRIINDEYYSSKCSLSPSAAMYFDAVPFWSSREKSSISSIAASRA